MGIAEYDTKMKEIKKRIEVLKWLLKQADEEETRLLMENIPF